MSNKHIIYYTTEKGVYFSRKGFNYTGQRQDFKSNNLRVNGGVELKGTHKPSWYFLEGETSIHTLENKLPDVEVDSYWELKNKEDTSLGLPETLTREDAAEDYDEEEYQYYISNPKYSRFSNLYKRVPVREGGGYENVTDEWKIEALGELEISEVTNNLSDMKVTWKEKVNFKEITKELDLSAITKYSEIEEMLISDLVIHNRPCYVSVDTTYKIIRSWVKDNINGKYARVTSDYDFCFTVKKVIPIKPYIRKTEILTNRGKSYAKPRFKEQTISDKMVEVFEMCPSKRYQKYTPIAPFKGDNLKDLADNIKTYLEELMDFLNAPLHECEHCKGTGHILESFDKNKR